MGKIELNTHEHTVSLASPASSANTGENKRNLSLTLKEFELLRLFMEHPGIVYTRDMLFDQIWNADYFGGTRTVDVHVKNLRTKLGACGELIKTVRGVGYKMEDKP